MAKSDAERARAYRERKKLRQAGMLPEPVKPEKLEIPRRLTLAQFIRSQGEEAIEAFDWLKNLGLSVDQFQTSAHKEQEIEWTYNLINDLDIALSTVTSTLSEYWVDQIDREIERLKAEELIDPTMKDRALSKIVQFTEMRKNLGKKYRLTLQNYEPEG